jgi:maltose-binding protein MalE
MTRFCIVTVLSLSAILGTSTVTQAQETIDMAKITCDQFNTGKISDPRSVSIWLSGFYHGMRNNTLVDVSTLQKNYQTINAYCFYHRDAILMDAVKSLFGAKN